MSEWKTWESRGGHKNSWVFFGFFSNVPLASKKKSAHFIDPCKFQGLYKFQKCGFSMKNHQKHRKSWFFDFCGTCAEKSVNWKLLNFFLGIFQMFLRSQNKNQHFLPTHVDSRWSTSSQKNRKSKISASVTCRARSNHKNRQKVLIFFLGRRYM